MKYWLSHKNSVLKVLFFSLFFLSNQLTKAQSIINGKVYESGTETALEGVSIINKKGQNGELTDRYGYYSVDANPGDSIEVKLVGYNTKSFIVPVGGKVVSQNVYLVIKKFQLKEVEVMARPDFKRDSLLNREENASIFDYKRPNAVTSIVTTVFHPLSGLDNLLNAAKRKRLHNFQDKLETQEQDRYIDSRFTRQLVSGLTSLHGSELETFMKLYRPSFEYIQSSTEYDLYTKIKEDYKDYIIYKTSKP